MGELHLTYSNGKWSSTTYASTKLRKNHFSQLNTGKSAINDRLLVLKGRKIVAFPDIDGYDDWTRKLAEYPELNVRVNPLLQQNATREDVEAHIDIADWLIAYCHPERSEGSPCNQ